MPEPFLHRLIFLGPLRSRPHLLGSIVMGALTALGLAFVPNPIGGTTRAPIAFDVGCIAFAVQMLWRFQGREASDIRRIAARQDEGKGLILALVIALASASLGAIVVELGAAKDAHGLERGIRVALGIGSVALSWFVVQLIFALHYAHEYYAPDDDDDPSTQEQGGLGFPGNEPPDYWDFLHFALVIGVASQTADIAFTSKRLRRFGTVHSLVAFVFNTAILALTINVVAGLF